MDVINTKILVACLFGVLRLFFGLLPIKLYKCLKIKDGEEDAKNEEGTFVNAKRHQQVQCGLAMFQSFGGGVIFATCFLHMMPEVYESTIELKKYGLIQSHYPFSQLIVSIGFFMIYFIEEVANYFVTKVPEEKFVRRTPVPSISSARTVTPSNKVCPEEEHVQTIIDEFPTPKKEPLKEDDDDLEEVQNNLNDLNVEKTQEVEQFHALDEIMESKSVTQRQIIRGLLIVLALSLHSFFEGLAIGLQTSLLNIWYLFVAISVHSATILFVVSLELLLAKARTRIIVVHVIILSVTSPLGVFLGLLLTLNADMETKAKSIAVVFLEGFSAGTMTYITFFEVLIREKERRICRLKRAFCIILGFGLMAILECGEMYY